MPYCWLCNELIEENEPHVEIKRNFGSGADVVQSLHKDCDTTVTPLDINYSAPLPMPMTQENRNGFYIARTLDVHVDIFNVEIRFEHDRGFARGVTRIPRRVWIRMAIRVLTALGYKVEKL
jgi:hypothetical protein